MNKLMNDEDCIIDFIQKIEKFSARESEDCIHCGRHVQQLRKVGRCVYASPCNCRIWQGEIPPAWMVIGSNGRAK